MAVSRLLDNVNAWSNRWVCRVRFRTTCRKTVGRSSNIVWRSAIHKHWAHVHEIAAPIKVYPAWRLIETTYKVEVGQIWFRGCWKNLFTIQVSILSSSSNDACAAFDVSSDRSGVKLKKPSRPTDTAPWRGDSAAIPDHLQLSLDGGQDVMRLEALALTAKRILQIDG